MTGDIHPFLSINYDNLPFFLWKANEFSANLAGSLLKVPFSSQVWTLK